MVSPNIYAKVKTLHFFLQEMTQAPEPKAAVAGHQSQSGENKTLTLEPGTIYGGNHKRNKIYGDKKPNKERSDPLPFIANPIWFWAKAMYWKRVYTRNKKRIGEYETAEDGSEHSKDDHSKGSNDHNAGNAEHTLR